MTTIDLITEEKKNDRRGTRPFRALLFLLVVMCGGMLYLWTIPGITFSVKYVCLGMAIVCFPLWYSYFYGRGRLAFLIKMFVVITFDIYLVMEIMMEDGLMIQFMRIAESISGKTDQEVMIVTEAALLLAVGIFVTLFVLEIVLKSRTTLYLLVSGLLLLGPRFGMRPGIKVVVLAVFFQITLWALHLPGRRSGSRRPWGKSVLVTEAVLAFSLLTAFVFVSFYSQELYDLVFETEEHILRAVKQLSDSEGEPVTGGGIHDGNNYQIGTRHLELTVSGQPTEALYLRGFSGGEYIGGDWIRSNDEQLFTAMAKRLGYGESHIADQYYSMYVSMNMMTGSRKNGEEQVPYSLTIRHFNRKYRNVYVPYYSRVVSIWHGIGENGIDDGYTFQYFERSDIDIEWDNVPADFEESRDGYIEVRDAYMEEIQAAYTQVPTELIPRMTELVEENPLEDLDEITAFILYTLHSNASYTLKPGWIPRDEEISEYFLFESGKGYCEHFALTATLLYRLYGIPARYATGYMVSPSAFTLQEDETYGAVVTDKDAHAWTEIFLADYGWIPVEVTLVLASDDSVTTNYPGFDGLELGRVLSEKNWNMDVPSLSQSDISSGNTANTAENMAFERMLKAEKYFEEHEKLLWILKIIFCCSVFLTPVFLNYRRVRRLKKMESMSCRKVFAKFMEMLHFEGYFQKYDGSEKEFVSAFAAEVPVISLEEIGQLQMIVCEAAYSSGNPTMEEEEMVRNIYFRTSRFLYDRLKWNRKLIFRYWKSYG